MQKPRDSGIISIDVPGDDPRLDWLGCYPRSLQQCQAQSRFAVHSRLDIVVNSETPSIKHFIGALHTRTSVHFEPEYSKSLFQK